MGLHAFLYLIYYVWFTIYNAIRAWRGKPVEDAVDYDEFGLLGVITRARRKQEIEKNIELARDRASICDMLNSRTEIQGSAVIPCQSVSNTEPANMMHIRSNSFRLIRAERNNNSGMPQ